MADMPELPDDFGADLIDQLEQRAPVANDDDAGAELAEQIGALLKDPAATATDEVAATPDEGPSAAAPAEDAAAGAESETPAPEPPDPAAASETPAAGEGGYVWQWYDTATNQTAEQRFTDAQVQQALQLASWANNLPEEVRYQLGMVESGQSVAIPRADFDRYQAWLNQQDRTQRDADLSNLDVEPDVAKVISDLRDQVTALQQGQQYQPQVNEQAINANLSATAQAYDRSISAHREAWKLTEDETNRLVRTVIDTGIARHLQGQYSQYNPVTQQLMAPADPNVVMSEALRYALYRDPALHQAVLARTTPSPTGAPEQAAAPDMRDATVTDIAAKRARAASLAAAPSAAVTPSPRTVRSMSDEEIFGPEGALTQELARAMNGHG